MSYRPEMMVSSTITSIGTLISRLNNVIRILANDANDRFPTQEPKAPHAGMAWFENSTGTLYIYSTVQGWVGK